MLFYLILKNWLNRSKTTLIYSINKSLIVLKVINKNASTKIEDENDFAYLIHEFGESYSGLKKGFTSTEKKLFSRKSHFCCNFFHIATFLGECKRLNRKFYVLPLLLLASYSIAQTQMKTAFSSDDLSVYIMKKQLIYIVTY